MVNTPDMTTRSRWPAHAMTLVAGLAALALLRAYCGGPLSLEMRAFAAVWLLLPLHAGVRLVAEVRWARTWRTLYRWGQTDANLIRHSSVTYSWDAERG
ncbi:hypothetical protein [Nonomuraea sp. SYSU D8015]|uniref:hypothetical protein n=1 Tax=Nonomuraea sp. SYSU D8015 TaxID=2593644 RepID=UPI0016609F8A|nr:hypothetical protein [Nonomuraea sp. SYSU D8015]